jgi:hypothetical protein
MKMKTRSNNSNGMLKYRENQRFEDQICPRPQGVEVAGVTSQPYNQKANVGWSLAQAPDLVPCWV